MNESLRVSAFGAVRLRLHILKVAGAEGAGRIACVAALVREAVDLYRRTRIAEATVAVYETASRFSFAQNAEGVVPPKQGGPLERSVSMALCLSGGLNNRVERTGRRCANAVVEALLLLEAPPAAGAASQADLAGAAHVRGGVAWSELSALLREVTSEPWGRSPALLAWLLRWAHGRPVGPLSLLELSAKASGRAAGVGGACVATSGGGWEAAEAVELLRVAAFVELGQVMEVPFFSQTNAR